MVAQGIVELLVMACSGWQCLDEYCGLVRVESGAGAWRASCSLCTLLGPEATRLRGLHSPGTLVVSGVVFENCRVDASIFVVKLLRAHGGCLGFRSR